MAAKKQVTHARNDPASKKDFPARIPNKESIRAICELDKGRKLKGQSLAEFKKSLGL